MGKKVIPVINNKHDIRFIGAEAGHLAGFDKDGKIIDGGTGFELPSGGQPGQVLGLDENGQLAWLTISSDISIERPSVSVLSNSPFSPTASGSSEPYTPE